MEVDKIIELANVIYNDIEKRGIEALINLFSAGKTLGEKINYEPNREYLKRIIFSQLDVGHMLFVHKYYHEDFEMRSSFTKETDEIRQKISSDSLLVFDANLLDALFGNSLGISTDEEYDVWKEFAYQDRHNGKNFDNIYFEEEFKYNYEKEENPFKKFIKSFKYKRMSKSMLLEDSYVKRVREMLKNGFINNPGDTFEGYRKCHKMLTKGVNEYHDLKQIEDIAKMVLISLMNNEIKPINIEESCRRIRTAIRTDETDKSPIMEFRKREIKLGSEEGIHKAPIIHAPHPEDIPKAMEELQARYEEAYSKEQGIEEYIRDIAKIYVDFIYIQPYEYGNKRTAACLLNSMLLSKRIIPPPVSLINDDQMVEAFYKAHKKDYKMLQDLVVAGYRKIEPDALDKNKDHGKGNLLIKEIEPITGVGVSLLDTDDYDQVIDKVVELPLQEACRLFTQKGIETVMSSANKSNVLSAGETPVEKEDIDIRNRQFGGKKTEFDEAGKGYAWIMLNFDTLSDENKDLIFNLEAKHGKEIWLVQPCDFQDIEFSLKIGRIDYEYLKQCIPEDEMPEGVEDIKVDKRLAEFTKRHTILGYNWGMYPEQIVTLRMPINESTTVEEVEEYFAKFAEAFKSQLRDKEIQVHEIET